MNKINVYTYTTEMPIVEWNEVFNALEYGWEQMWW